MAFQSVPGCVEITVNAVLNGQNVQNTFHAYRGAAFDSDDMQTLATAIGSTVSTYWLALWASAVAFTGIGVRALENINDLYLFDDTFADNGADTDAELPANVALAIKKLSGLTGRSARGRVYWFGLTYTMLTADANYVLGTDANNIVGAVDYIRQAITGAVWTPVIISRFYNGSKRPYGTWNQWVSTALTNTVVDSRRDRLP